MLLRMLRPTDDTGAEKKLRTPGGLAFAIIIVSTNLFASERELFADQVEKLSPAVVNISTTTVIDGPAVDCQFRRDRHLKNFLKILVTIIGSGRLSHSIGLCHDDDGIVVTNYHVIENAEEIRVVLADETSLPLKF